MAESFKNLKSLFWLLPIALFLKVNESLAQTKSGGTTPAELTDPFKNQTFTSLLNKIIDWLLVASVPILAIMILIGGFYILTAGGNAEKVKTGRNVILYAVIGFIVILVSKGVGLILLELTK